MLRDTYLEVPMVTGCYGTLIWDVTGHLSRGSYGYGMLRDTYLEVPMVTGGYGTET